MKTALQAAQEISTLINARAQSPRIDEMEAVIVGAMPRQHACARATEDDPSLCALGQKLQEVNQLYQAAKDTNDCNIFVPDGWFKRREKAS